MCIGAAAQRPIELALRRGDGMLADTRNAPLHQTILVEFIVFVAVSAKPGGAVIAIFIGEADGDAVAAEAP